jgi:GT2 family glycosyltransferase
MSEIGIVVIGRNEGERLLRCLDSVTGRGPVVVYVDSGSTDGSLAAARARGVEVVELDLSVPFTAARARNAGLERLLEIAPETGFVQFVDGDCEVVPGWLDRAQAELQTRPELAIVCGRLRERFADRSIYNRLADMEWDTPVGDTAGCGGIAMMRVEALRQVDGFHPGVIAGEEWELCVRLRAQGWTITRINAEMALHDIAMTRFSQWWTRGIRNGYAYALGATLHGSSPAQHWVREVRSIAVWGLVLPALIVILAWPTRGASVALALAYPLLGIRIAVRRRRSHRASWSDALLYAGACVLAKFPQALGLLRQRLERQRGQVPRLIEYKSAEPAGVAAGAEQEML